MNKLENFFNEHHLVRTLFLVFWKCLYFTLILKYIISVGIKFYIDNGFLSAIWSYCSPVAASLFVPMLCLLDALSFLFVFCALQLYWRRLSHILSLPSPFCFTSLLFESLALCGGLSSNLTWAHDFVSHIHEIDLITILLYCFAQVFKGRRCYQVLSHTFDSNILHEIIFINFVLR